MPEFLAAYALHDSDLTEIRFRPDDGLVVHVGLDLVWNARVPRGYGRVRIWFPTTYWFGWVEGGWYQSTLASAESQLVSEADRAALLTDGRFSLDAHQGGEDQIPHPAFDLTLTRTKFELMNWGRFEILHAKEVRISCSDGAGGEFSVNSIGAR